MTADSRAPKQQIGRPFKPGQSGNPAGRPKGSKNALGERFVSDLQAHWKEHGQEALDRCCEEDPSAYVRVVASIIPKDVIVHKGENLSKDELRELLAAIRSERAAREDGNERSIEPVPPGGEGQSDSVH